MNEISTADGAGRYEIRLKGHLDTRWADWFDGLTLTRCSDGTTTIRGLVVDQSGSNPIPSPPSPASPSIGRIGSRRKLLPPTFVTPPALRKPTPGHRGKDDKLR